MKISYEWLREYINTKIRADNLSSLLTMAGHEVTSQEEKNKDIIFDIEVTPNRSDCLSYIGIAREASCIAKKRLMIPPSKITSKKSKAKPIKVSIEEKIACPRYSARVIKDVHVGQSPKWLIKRVESMGLRPVNNIVDITNFVLFETGQPLHAFDLDKLEGGVTIRNAKDGEKIITIDEVERELRGSMLIIADSRKPVAIAGVMGGKETEVTETTKNILLESAYFDPISIRRTALTLSLASDSSYRFERGVDLEGVVSASDRAASLIADTTKGAISALTDSGIKKKESININLRPAYLNRILGIKLSVEEIKDILKRLCFNVKGASSMEVTPPSFRNDVTREADLIEEVARIYGYETIKPQPPSIMVTDESPGSKDFIKKKDITREVLTSLGFNETLTYSLLSRKVITDASLPEEGIIEIMNPLSREQEVMRQSLIPGALKSIYYNASRQAQDIKVFELSDIYFEKESIYNEEQSLVIAEYAKTGRSMTSYDDSELFHIKGTVDILCEKLGMKTIEFEKTSHPLFVNDETVGMLLDGAMLGIMGRIKPDLLSKFDIKGDVSCCEINFKALADSSILKKFYRPLPRFPFSYRDVSFAIDSNISYKELASFVKREGGMLVERIELLSEYRGDKIKPGQRGLAIRIIYRSKEKTLTEEEINNIDTAIREGLTKNFNATLR
ncbi:MAG: phenylalanine--tRNA ligase subunit beta [Candidatus Omnitrophica bacterium]|nr:phenylalanine--tRNA ligase subunit beta [Candidatus Omnitrophota bacterium]